MLRNLFVFAMTIGAATTASAGLELWSGNPTNVSITLNNVQILAPGTFKFQSVTSGNLDVIGSITVTDGVTGEVIVYIERDTDNDSPGATNVGAINLTNNQGANLTGNLAELRITGDLATTEGVVCSNITGEIEIGGDLDGHNIVVADDIDEDITIDGLLAGNITADSMENLTITGTNAQTGDHTGSITINGQYTEEITIGTDGGREAAMQGRVAHPSLAMDGGAIFLESEFVRLSNAQHEPFAPPLSYRTRRRGERLGGRVVNNYLERSVR